ncbi:MAG: hypothetical protein U0W65_15550 [Bacteroidia bacterium]
MEIKKDDRVILKWYGGERIYIVKQVFPEDIKVDNVLICAAGDIRIVNENNTNDVMTLNKTQVEIIYS